MPNEMHKNGGRQTVWDVSDDEDAHAVRPFKRELKDILTDHADGINIRKRTTKPLDKPSVDLDSDHVTANTDEFAGHRAESRPNLHNMLRAHRGHGLRNRSQCARANEEVLPEPLARSNPILRQNAPDRRAVGQVLSERWFHGTT